ncbi:MAG: hypothetical protein ACTHU0_09915 [Kofleriaceae bacterium]
MIGANALAIHNYVRGTVDIDFATSVAPTRLRSLDEAVRSLGAKSKLRMPDEDDPLGGMLVVWEREDEDDWPLEPVEVVNFYNPWRPRQTPAEHAIASALRLDEHSALRYVRLPDLVALKFYAGGPGDHADILQLLIRNPDADLDEIRAVAGPYDAHNKLEELIDQASRRR